MIQSTFTLTTNNTLRVLQRIASVFSRNRINIKQLQVQETLCQTLADFSIVIEANSQITKRIEQQLTKIIEIKNITCLQGTNKIHPHAISKQEQIAS